MRSAVIFAAIIILQAKVGATDDTEHPMMRVLTKTGRAIAWHPGLPPIGLRSNDHNHPLSDPECREEGAFAPTNVYPPTKWPICLKPDPETIADYIDIHGSWPDCAALPYLYFGVPGHRGHFTGKNGLNHGRTFFFDVGSNVGACSLEMLVRLPEVHVVAFEPSPYNHFYLSRSMIRLAKVMPSVLQRFVLLPVAVGNSTASGETLFMKHNKGNQGATELIPPGKEDKDNNFIIKAPIWAIDKLVKSTMLHKDGSLVKMDIQGAECHAINGMRQVLEGVGVLKSELNPAMLEKQGCGTKMNDTNSLALMEQMRGAGFDIENEDGLPCDTRKEIQSALFDVKKYRMHGNIDYVARKSDSTRKHQRMVSSDTALRERMKAKAIGQSPTTAATAGGNYNAGGTGVESVQKKKKRSTGSKGKTRRDKAI
mmetsp:Transcript_85605/g.171371  ORF Transcript_85605/g.171371 Transcript_85605/m.171371 type:complete len:425 (-) Transcript_85605:359-1633(-)